MGFGLRDWLMSRRVGEGWVGLDYLPLLTAGDIVYLFPARSAVDAPALGDKSINRPHRLIAVVAPYFVRSGFIAKVLFGPGPFCTRATKLFPALQLQFVVIAAQKFRT
jgi:hypothetical protein